MGMDMSWVLDRLAVGGGIWIESQMREVAAAGITHIIDLQVEFDDTPLARPLGLKVLWNPMEDDFEPMDPEMLRRGAEFAMDALKDAKSKVYIHCAAGVHRGPTMALAVLRAMGYELAEAKRMIRGKRPEADFVDVYVKSVERFMRAYEAENGG